MNRCLLAHVLPILSGAWLALFVSTTPLAAAPGDEHWSSQFGWPGTLENVNAICLHQGKLYFAGAPSTAATNASIDTWDGNQFTRVAQFSGGSGTVIYDLAFVGNTLYAAGSFTNVEGIAARSLARWDGNTWTGLGLTNGAALALVTQGTDLYAGGLFTNPGGVALTNIGRWDGSAWHALGSGLGGTNRIPSDVVRALLITNGVIYAAGNFSNAGTQALSHIAMWNGVTWSPVGGGISGTTVFGLGWHGSSLYAVGAFSQAGATPVNKVARWDGLDWSALGSGISGVNSVATSIDTFGNAVCVGGTFTSAGGNAATNFAVWDGSTWSSAGGNPSASVSRTYSTGTNVYVGGNFLAAAGRIMAGLAAWDGVRWSAIGPEGKMAGLSTTVRAIASDGSNIYAGGAFTLAGQTNAARVGRYDGANWRPFGTGLNDDVRQLAVVGTNLYAAGDFSGGAGGPLALRLAQWNGAQWVPLNNTAFNDVKALAVRSNDLFVAGYFGITAANGTASWFTRWDGTNFWDLLKFDSNTFNAFYLDGIGFSAMAVQSTNIYLSGHFTVTPCDANFENCVSCSNVLRFDGTYGRIMGTGLNTNANAITVIGSDVYFAGPFTNAGGVTVNRIAKWDGQVWSNVGGIGVVGSGTINALAAIGHNLYAGGTFTNINGVPASRIARWNGTNWSALGSGTAFSASSGPVLALAAVGQDLYVGGTFRTAGGKPSYYLARWNEQIDFDFMPTIQLSKLHASTIGPFKMLVTASGVPSYVIEGTTDFSSWVPLLTNTTSPYEFWDFTAPSRPFRFYRARQGP